MTARASASTRAQLLGLYRVYRRWGIDLGETYREFRQRVYKAGYDDCIMVNVGSMWLGIETDGYTHT